MYGRPGQFGPGPFGPGGMPASRNDPYGGGGGPSGWTGPPREGFPTSGPNFRGPTPFSQPG